MLRRVPEIENPDGPRIMLFDKLPVPQRAVAQDYVNRFRVERDRAAHLLFVVFAADWRGRPVKPSGHDLDRGLRRWGLQFPSRRLLDSQLPDLLRDISNETGRKL